MAYTDEQKQIALSTYTTCRNDAEKAAKFCREHYDMHITGQTIRTWAKGENIHPSVKENLEEKKLALADLFEVEIRAAFGTAGDKREEASYRDLMVGIGILTDKAQLLRGEPTSITQQNMTDDERAQRVETLLHQARKRKEGYAGK